jgi:NAD-dependent SIR2 family protein deacetylase
MGEPDPITCPYCGYEWNKYNPRKLKNRINQKKMPKCPNCKKELPIADIMPAILESMPNPFSKI